jgi:hypothetical protein
VHDAARQRRLPVVGIAIRTVQAAGQNHDLVPGPRSDQTNFLHPNAPMGLSPASAVFGLSDGVHQYPMELSQHQPLVLSRQHSSHGGG